MTDVKVIEYTYIAWLVTFNMISWMPPKYEVTRGRKCTRDTFVRC